MSLFQAPFLDSERLNVPSNLLRFLAGLPEKHQVEGDQTICQTPMDQMERISPGKSY